MNRQLINAMAAQYATPEVSGNGLVSWEGGKKCVIPSVKLYGAAVQDGIPTPDAPVMPVCNNGVFVSRGRNLFDIQSYPFTQGEWVSWSLGTLNSSANFAATRDYIPCIPGVTITLNKRPGGENPGFAFYSDASGLAYLSGIKNGGAEAGTPMTVTVPDEAKFMRFTVPAGEADTGIQIELGDTATPYTPYYDGGQAQAPELWSIPGTDYRDEWDPQTGWGIRRCKKVELNGTENWGVYSAAGSETGIVFRATFPDAAFGFKSSICSHFQNVSRAWLSGYKDMFGIYSDYNTSPIYFWRPPNEKVTTLDEMKSYLAAQYAAGTPVTIWYPLAEPEPFETAPQPLTMPTGYGQIIQVSGDVPDYPVTAKYLTHS